VIQVHRRHRFWDVKEKQWVAGHVVVGWPEGNHGPLHRRRSPSSWTSTAGTTPPTTSSTVREPQV